MTKSPMLWAVVFGLAIVAVMGYSLLSRDHDATEPLDASSPASGESTTKAMVPEPMGSEEADSKAPLVGVVGRYPDISIAELRDGNAFVARVTIDAAGPVLYNTASGDPPITRDAMDPGNLLFSVVAFSVDEAYKNDTGAPLTGIVGLSFGGDIAGSAMVVESSALYSAGQTGILFGGPIPTELAEEPMGQAVQEDATLDGMYPAKIGVWCPIEGDEVVCHPIELGMGLQELVNQLDQGLSP